MKKRSSLHECTMSVRAVASGLTGCVCMTLQSGPEESTAALIVWDSRVPTGSNAAVMESPVAALIFGTTSSSRMSNTSVAPKLFRSSKFSDDAVATIFQRERFASWIACKPTGATTKTLRRAPFQSRVKQVLTASTMDVDPVFALVGVRYSRHIGAEERLVRRPQRRAHRRGLLVLELPLGYDAHKSGRHAYVLCERARVVEHATEREADDVRAELEVGLRLGDRAAELRDGPGEVAPENGAAIRAA